MPNNDDLMRALIAGYKTCEAPSAATRARIQQALAAAQEEAPARVATIPVRRAAALPWLALAAGLVLLVAWRAGWQRSAGLVAGARGELSSFSAAATDPGLVAEDRAAPAGAPQVTAPSPSDAADRAPPEAAGAPPVAADEPPGPGADQPPGAGADDRHDAGADEPSDAGASASPLPSAARRGPSGGGKRRQATPAPAAGVAADPADPVLEEMALLQRSREALRAHRPAESLALLDRYAEAFPRGLLIEEGQALRVAALCAAGETERAHAARAAFIRTYPRSAYAGRVVAACPDLSPQQSGGSQSP